MGLLKHPLDLESSKTFFQGKFPRILFHLPGIPDAADPILMNPLELAREGRHSDVGRCGPICHGCWNPPCSHLTNLDEELQPVLKAALWVGFTGRGGHSDVRRGRCVPV